MGSHSTKSFPTTWQLQLVDPVVFPFVDQPRNGLQALAFSTKSWDKWPMDFVSTGGPSCSIRSKKACYDSHLQTSTYHIWLAYDDNIYIYIILPHSNVYHYFPFNQSRKLHAVHIVKKFIVRFIVPELLVISSFIAAVNRCFPVHTRM